MCADLYLHKRKEILFKTDYDSIKPVYSIWICMNKESNSLSHLHLAKDELLGSCEWEGNMDLINIVLIGLSSKIPEPKESFELQPFTGDSIIK